MPFRAGFDRIAAHLASINRPKSALCAADLRCARPYTAVEFQAPDGFNGHYVRLLTDWGLVPDGHAAAARTNVAPDAFPPDQQVVFSLSYTVESPGTHPSFVVSGATEGSMIFPGESSAEALRSKIANVVGTLDTRITGLGVHWDDVTAISMYGIEEFWPYVRSELFQTHPAAARVGVNWFASRPPIEGLALELDLRATRNEIALD